MDSKTDASAKRQTATAGHEVAAAPGDPVQVYLLQGEGVSKTTAPAEEWVLALQRYRQAASRHHELTLAVSVLMQVAVLWAKERPWVREISALFPKESNQAVTLVFTVPSEGVAAEQHMEAVGMGLAVGGVLDLIVEPRVVDGLLPEAPTGWMVVYRKED